MATGMREKTTNVGGVIKRIWYAMTGTTQGLELASLDDTGKFKCVSEQISNLAGTGNRMVVADSTGNLSASDLKTSFTPVISAAVGTITSYTVNYCYVSKIGKLIKQTAYVSVTNKGTAAGDLTMSLYSTCASTGICIGQNATLGTGVGGICSATTAFFRKMDGTTPIAENNFALTAEYYEA